MNKFNKKVKKFLRKKSLPIPISKSSAQYSVIAHITKEEADLKSTLVSISLEAINEAKNISLDDITPCLNEHSLCLEIWPGEHYKLLAGLMLTLKPKRVIEIGTYTGLSALVIKKYLPKDSTLSTFDIIPWDEIEETCLQEEDFVDKRLIQCVDDLSDIKVVKKHKDLLQKTDLFFIDASKDGIMERKLIDNFKEIGLEQNPIFIFDDIRVWNMLGIWESIKMPKLDLTSFGHWSGTGIVQWVHRD